MAPLARPPRARPRPMLLSPRAQPYLIAIVACVLLAASAGYDLYRERDQAIRTARLETASLVRVLEEHVHQTLRRAEVELDELAERPAGAAPVLPADGFLAQAGPVAAPAQADAGPAEAWAARLHAARPGELLVDRAREQVPGQWRLRVGRRPLSSPGAAQPPWQADIDLQPLQRLLDAADTGRNGFATLFSTSGWLLATAPLNPALFARNWADAPMFREHLPRAEVGTVQQVVARDGTERVYSYRRVRGYPLVMSAGMSMTDALAPWRLRVLWDGILLALVSMAFAGGAFGLSRSIQRREAALQALDEAGQAVQRSETFLRTLTDNLPLAIAYFDTGHRLRFANRVQCQHLGLARERLLGQTLAELGRPLPPGLAEATQRVLQGQEQSLEIEETDASGQRHVLACLLVPDRCAEGGVAGYCCACLDVTDRVDQRRRLDAALQERETLLREVYHRVKNNLQVIQSLLRLQRRAVADPAARQALDESAGRVRAMALVHEMLYQSGSLQAVSLRAYTRELLGHLAELSDAQARGVRLEAEVVDVEARLELAIPYGLLVSELVGNSLKHAFDPGSAGLVQVRVERAAKGLRLTLSDNGVGLPKDFALDRDASMGLQLAASLCTQLGGQLVPQSETGTVFVVEMTLFD